MTHPSLDRRTLIRTAGVVGAGTVGAAALAACGSTGSSTDTGVAGAAPSSSGTPADGTSSSAATGSATSSAAGAAPAGLTVATSSVPVGGGTVLTDAAVVVTQPTAGTFKAFSAICTHQGCPVTKVVDGKIECPCHGSMFDITTGAPTAGPAQRPLGAKTATVSGSDVVIS